MDTLKLDQNVNTLTRETTHRLDTDAGPKYVKANSLLDQLREAVESSMKGGGGRAQKNTLPLNADALDLLNDIKTTATEYWSLFTQTHTVHGTLENRIQTWAANTRSHREEATQTAERITTGWIKRIESLFNPPNIRPLQKPCPHCSRLKADVEKDGETVRTWALTVDVTGDRREWHASCAWCGAEWANEDMGTLLTSLDYTPLDTPLITTL